MTKLIIEVNKKQKQVLTGIMKYLNLPYRELDDTPTKILDPYKFRKIVDFGIDSVHENEVETPFTHVQDASEYVRQLRNTEWK